MFWLQCLSVRAGHTPRSIKSFIVDTMVHSGPKFSVGGAFKVFRHQRFDIAVTTSIAQGMSEPEQQRDMWPNSNSTGLIHNLDSGVDVFRSFDMSSGTNAGYVGSPNFHPASENSLDDLTAVNRALAGSTITNETSTFRNAGFGNSEPVFDNGFEWNSRATLEPKFQLDSSFGAANTKELHLVCGI